jgi:dihydroorotate dehydrogenase
MGWIYRNLLRPILFAQDSEIAHDRTLTTLAWLSKREIFCGALSSFFEAPELRLQMLGLSFPNPLGLAAGMDKGALAVPAWAALGFGFSELGGVTWHPQAGNPPPRMFRAIEEGALINRMGFNNPGAQAMAERLAAWRRAGRWPPHPIGINLGKSKITPLQNAAEDYANSLNVLWPYADFFVVNVSSPNTPNLRQLQDRAALAEILAALQEVNVAASRNCRTQNGPVTFEKRASLSRPSGKPILVKISPDLPLTALDEILELVEPRQIAGIVATNTTTSRPWTNDPEVQSTYSQPGGLSGRPLRERSTEIIRHLYTQTRGCLPIIGVGGVFNPSDAWEKITAGASLVQTYTGLIYEGPGIAKEIVSGLKERLARSGLKEISQAVGSEARRQPQSPKIVI